ncbi:methylmalonyl-CoA epimerase, mitochondrial isoform X5 [Alligator mississippiensis]|uniref:methylmalonyl-CoA epimerase, mitochondrial isoform X5 n=1 Tax=Alligator mississippiensis TaxID=8496 RepID=UPI0009070EEA|nr:methylmalonyl-CoA epimerase, mitochondrial isoform X5 [Alligator mississippiensis]
MPHEDPLLARMWLHSDTQENWVQLINWCQGLLAGLQATSFSIRTSATISSTEKVPHSLWKLGRLNHVAIAVPDLEKARSLYKDVLGAQVDDITAAVAELKKRKIRILSEEPKIGAHGKPVIFLHPKDCHGVLVELEQA